MSPPHVCGELICCLKCYRCCTDRLSHALLPVSASWSVKQRRFLAFFLSFSFTFSWCDCGCSGAKTKEGHHLANSLQVCLVDARYAGTCMVGKHPNLTQSCRMLHRFHQNRYLGYYRYCRTSNSRSTTTRTCIFMFTRRLRSAGG